MAMDASFELSRFGPGVGVEQPVALQRDAGLCEALPKWLGFSLQQQVIVSPSGLMLSQSMSRLIDANHPRGRMSLGNERRAHAGATE